jgi:hypothetical protein
MCLVYAISRDVNSNGNTEATMTSTATMTETLTMASEATKECGRCHQSKPESAFYRGWRWCRACEKAHAAERAEARAGAIRSVTFGIEIETFGISREQAAAAVAVAVGGTVEYTGGTYETRRITMADGRSWTVVRDGSLAMGGAEVVSPICRFDDIATVQEVVRALRRAGARVDESCGIHVHIGIDQLGAAGCTRLVRIVAAHDATIQAMLGIHASRRHYCRALPSDIVARIDARRPATMTDLAEAWYGTRDEARLTSRRQHHYDDSRYHGLNIHSAFYRGTVEFRWFNGTLHAGKVRAYIMLALGLAAKVITNKTLFTSQRSGATKQDAIKLLDKLFIKGAEFENCRTHLLAGFGAAERE